MNRFVLVKETAVPTTLSKAELIGAQDSIGHLAALMERARNTFGDVSGQVSNHLQMAEMDLLSARDAIEKACWEMDVLTPTIGNARSPAWSAGEAADTPPTGAQISTITKPTSLPRTRRPPGRTAPGEGQGELFPLHING